ncbi:MAG: glutamate--tRNA ligase [Bacilli bacterium]
MTNKDFADLLFPNIKSDIEFYENKYPLRDIEPGRFVTRFAPSPTGVVHFGTLYCSLINKKVSDQTKGIFYLRIEDTDQKRSVENGITDIIRDLKNYEINFDEGMINETESQGEYGPYLQSQRKEIYETYAKYLVAEGLAYPCFCTEEDLENQRKHQEKIKARLGYYGKYAVCRKIPIEKAAEKIKAGDSYILRLKSLGDFDKKIKINDLIKGEIEFPENDLDIVLIKNDGLPTYHFAHAVDDHLMRTTHVIRGDEWISSLPIHLQLFQALKFKFPKYAHFSPLMKIDENGTRRKLSKRKDPEAAVSYYHEKGIPKEAVKLYVMTVANSNFEMWLEQNPTKGISDFVFDFKKVSPSGSLFDFEKLLNISKNYISHLSKEEVYQELLTYTKEFDIEFFNILLKYPEYSQNIFNIEREQKKPRKDYVMYSTIKNEVWYMFDEYFSGNLNYIFDKVNDKKEISEIIKTYLEKYYVFDHDETTWFEKIKELAISLGYADTKEYKLNPNQYKGSVADIAAVIRVALTTTNQTPNLYQIMKLLGEERVKERLEKFIK